jgi:CRP/FNR family cyclic AMP-dependent transcriptional regulator
VEVECEQTSSRVLTAHSRTARRVQVLDLDEALLPDADEVTRRRLTAPLMRLRRGRWTPPDSLRDRSGQWLGLLVVDGLMIRTLRVNELECCELLGPGDVIRPWDGGDDMAPLATGASWRVVDDARVVLLDEVFTRMACQWPQVLSQLMDRGLRRSRALAVQLAISQARRADARVLSLFWHLADRWGRVTPEGVLIELDLTHSLLSRLTCLRRPTVSVTLKELREKGQLVSLSRSTWLLNASWPGERPGALGLPAAA